MSEFRDPERDQQLPESGMVCVQDFLIERLGTYVGTGLQENTEATIRALEERKEYGIRKYGRPLEAGNGRDALLDAWEEALDLYCYLTQMELERDSEEATERMSRNQLFAAKILYDLTDQRLKRGDVL